MLDSMELQMARIRVQNYEHEADGSIIRSSELAQDCLDCEEMLDKGIQSLHWLQRAEEVIVEGAAEGLCEVTSELDAVFASLYRDWLKPCQIAKNWIADCQKNGFDVRNHAEFLECCDRAEAWLEQNAHFQQAKAIRDARFAQEPW